MRPIALDVRSFMASPIEKKFILLRSEKADKDLKYLQNFAIPKILNRKDADKMPGVWGTLGYADNTPVDWEGQLFCSNEGNDKFEDKSTVGEEVKLIKEMYPELDLQNDVKEKVVNLSELDIPYPDIFALEEIPKLRLDAFLGPDQGALAFYQHQRENNEAAELDYILPIATTAHNTNERDRLTYIFNALPHKAIEAVPGIPNRYRLSTQYKQEEFIVKVLVFKRAYRKNKEKDLPSNSQEIVELIEDELASYKTGLFVKDHQLLVMNDKGKFRNANFGSIKESKKTLLLLHGTFASTKGSFGEVYDWLHDFLKEGNYEQVIAFDHPTFFWDAEGNIKKMFSMLNDLDIQAFDQEVDVIGTSQGGLLAQFLANYGQDSIRVGKVALVASGNGVGYLTFAEGMAFGFKMLKKVMRKIGIGAPVVFISALLQHSFEWVIKQPGMEVMKPGSEALNKIIYNTPIRESTRYLPVAGNYENNGWGARKLELGIDKILSEHNDWVISTKNQFSLPSQYVAIEGYNPAKYKKYMIDDALHGRLIEKQDCKDKIESFFFTEEAEKVDYNKLKSIDHFDAHCHLFGRNVITGRLILMLLGDIVEYLDQDNPDEQREPISTREGEGSEHGIGRVIRNVFNYFLFNKGARQMLDDLEEDYWETRAHQPKTFRYIPLMFDLEMTFRNDYDADNAASVIAEKMQEFKVKHAEFLDQMDSLVQRFEENGEFIFSDEKVPNEDSVRILKYAKKIIKGLNLVNASVLEDAKNSYKTQKQELEQLKTLYGNDIFPFLAVDPRREGMAQEVEENIGKDKVFHGVKLYTPNGYSPTDLNLFDPEKAFVHGTSLYKWCEENQIPIMAHCSDSGFATFTDRIQIYGDLCTQEEDTSDNDYTYKLVFKDKAYHDFEYNLLQGGFDKSIKERAHRLNHPTLWRKVLEKYPDLKICLAHFGGGSHEWQEEIKRLILDFDNVYTDLSCQTKPEMLQTIAERYFKTDTADNQKIRSRIMYGSDYFLNMLQGIAFKNYYGNFQKAFSEQHMEYMSVKVVKEYLGV
ncbi:alpha/beta fold hydrolase [Marivirga arenosa]|uniref:Alpha/beta fold hydrolase n=1 Tax=Marivirga arenosa TaxID=3059076 RepID=A0AA51R9R8_9BACT|nr:amidohydrolase family protein [Marivirga sp. ABR2-2]WMN06053.1 alpha/beta fold hydrolase [Marivirga sp. ABR2-2]